MIAISIFFSPVCSINIYSSTWHWSLFSSICATDLLYKYWQCSEHVFAGFCENFSNTPCQCRHLVWEVQVSCSSAPKAALKCYPPHATMFSCSAFSSSGWPLWRIEKAFWDLDTSQRLLIPYKFMTFYYVKQQKMLLAAIHKLFFFFLYNFWCLCGLQIFICETIYKL